MSLLLLGSLLMKEKLKFYNKKWFSFYLFFYFLNLVIIINNNGCKSEVIELNDKNFDEETKNNPWFLEFYAPWCGHCKNFAPIYEQGSNHPDIHNKIRFGKIDATVEKDLAKRFDVNRFPTVKFYELGQEYQYNDKRTVEGLTEFGKKMLKPLLQDFTISKVNEHLISKYKYEMIFIYVKNNNNNNNNNNNDADEELLIQEARRYRPYIVLYKISYESFIQLPKTYILETLKLSSAQWQEITNSQNNEKLNYLISVSSSQKQASNLINSNQHNMYAEFLANNQFGLLVQLDEINHRLLTENSWYLGLAIVDFNNEQQKQTNKFLEELESLAVMNPSWRKKQRSHFATPQFAEKTENKDIELEVRFPFLIAIVNYTAFTEFLKDTLSLTASDLPLLVIFDNKEDGYYKSHNVSKQYIQDVFEKKLEITYSRNWFVRKAATFERFLNGLSGWQMFLFFGGIFVSIFGLMIAIDYFCSPDYKPKEQ